MPVSGIAVEMFGQNIGAATINDDGTIELDMESPNTLGQQIMARMQAGEFTSFVLRPIEAPRPPAPPSDE